MAHLPHTRPKDDVAHLKGLRAIATLELIKGTVAGTVAVLFLIFADRDFGVGANRVLDFFHAAPGGHIAVTAVDFANNITAHKVDILARIALVYAAIRFVEGYGLWFARVWAEFFALISGTLYLPWEVYEIFQRPTVLRWLVLILNVIIVAYIARLRFTKERYKTAEQLQRTETPAA